MNCAALTVILIFFIALYAGEFKFNDDRNLEILTDSAGNARVEDSVLILIDGTRNGNLTNLVIVNDVYKYKCGKLKCEFDFTVEKGAEGFGIAFIEKGKLNADSMKRINWSEPGIKNALSVGFDIYDPVTVNMFDSYGNYMDKPQREISLHYNGREYIKKLSDVEYRDSEKHHADIAVKEVCGGALCTVSIDGIDIIRDYFIPHFMPFSVEPVFGATTCELTTYVTIDNLKIEYAPSDESFRTPVRVDVFNNAVLHGGQREIDINSNLPLSIDSTGRILLTLKLSAPPGGFDRWDRGGAPYVWNNDEKFEIMRFITPFGRGFEWTVDVTDYGRLLTGNEKFTIRIDTWTEAAQPDNQTGWAVDAYLEYYPGFFIFPSGIYNVWSGMFEYGNPESPLDSFTKEQIYFFQDYVQVKLLIRVTEHGQYPASLNAGEFLPAERTVTVNKDAYIDTIWKDDCYLNPCRPQGGTWKYSRAGWAPGSIVEGKTMNLSSFTYEKHINLKYKTMPYVNENRNEAKAWYWIEAQLFVY